MKTSICLLATILGLATGSAADPSLHLSQVRSFDDWPTQQFQFVAEDESYRFISRSYGSGGKQAPGLFVFSKLTGNWMQVMNLSTEGAKLGRSPDPKDALLQVGWDFSHLASQPYVPVPLVTGGAIIFPDEIILDPKTQIYAFRCNSSFKLEYVVTAFHVRKSDLDAAFK